MTRQATSRWNFSTLAWYIAFYGAAALMFSATIMASAEPITAARYGGGQSDVDRWLMKLSDAHGGQYLIECGSTQDCNTVGSGPDSSDYLGFIRKHVAEPLGFNITSFQTFAITDGSNPARNRLCRTTDNFPIGNTCGYFNWMDYYWGIFLDPQGGGLVGVTNIAGSNATMLTALQEKLADHFQPDPDYVGMMWILMGIEWLVVLTAAACLAITLLACCALMAISPVIACGLLRVGVNALLEKCDSSLAILTTNLYEFSDDWINDTLKPFVFNTIPKMALDLKSCSGFMLCGCLGLIEALVGGARNQWSHMMQRAGASANELQRLLKPAPIETPKEVHFAL